MTLKKPPTWEELYSRFVDGSLPPPDARLGEAVRRTDTSKGYLAWDEVRHRTPEGWSPSDFWAHVKLRRMFASRRLDLLRSETGEPFLLSPSDPLAAAQHRIDTKETLWKGLFGSGEGPDSEVSYRLMAAIEEAHHSSAIEGAVTTRQQSRELIRSKRAPRDRSERMVLNSFRTMQRLGEWAKEPLTSKTILEIHASVTDGTLDDSADVGRMREGDDVQVWDAATNEVVFVPPPAQELPERIERLCEFANEAPSDEIFLHPITRAILIHHQLAYDHPFADGNGRTARALFMWSILRSGYPWFRSLSISRAVHRTRDRYYRSFQLVQSDDGDVTYFVRHQMECIEEEIRHLSRFLEHRGQLERWLIEKKAVSERLNRRQLALVDHALNHPEAAYAVAEHARYHGVSQPTAWKDLRTMAAEGLFEEEKAGKKALYRPTGKLKRLAGKRPPRLVRREELDVDDQG